MKTEEKLPRYEKPDFSAEKKPRHPNENEKNADLVGKASRGNTGQQLTQLRPHGLDELLLLLLLLVRVECYKHNHKS